MANLKMQLSKCVFGETKVNFLGFIVDNQGYTPDKEKLKAVENFVRPLSVKQLRTFLGLASYYRRFIYQFAKIAYPLNNLLKHDVPYEWTTDCEESFQTLKKRLISPPILVHFDEDKPVFLVTDASGEGLGAMLAHEENNVEHPIGYFSRSLTKHEKRYSASELEMLAIVWAVRKLRHYLLGRQFTIVTDHRCLCSIMNMSPEKSKLVRWGLTLLEFNFVIKYRTGKTNVCADCLSRLKQENINDDDIVSSIPIMSCDIFDWPEAQKNDHWCQEISRKIEAKNKKTEDEGYIIENKVLYRELWTDLGIKKLVCLPKKLLPALLFQCHDSPTAGHFGQTKTLFRLRKLGYRPGLEKIVNKYVASCLTCQTRKKPRQKPIGLLQKIPTSSYPFEVISLDFIGPVNESDDGKNSILNMVCHATRYCECKAYSEQTAENVIDFLNERLVARHGCPRIIITDRGVQFTSHLFKEFCRDYDIIHYITSAYSPQSNGACERLNGTIVEVLSKYVNDKQREWSKYLPFAAYAYNTSVQDSTRFTPFSLVYGREPIDSVNIRFNLDAAGKDIQLMQQMIDQYRETAEQNVSIQQDKSALIYNPKHRFVSYEPGDLVLVFTPRLKPGAHKKWAHLHSGPFVVLKRLNEVNYELLDLREETRERYRRDIYHVRRLKRFFQRYQVNHRDEFAEEAVNPGQRASSQINEQPDTESSGILNNVENRNSGGSGSHDDLSNQVGSHNEEDYNVCPNESRAGPNVNENLSHPSNLPIAPVRTKRTRYGRQVRLPARYMS
jgi:transposase InsO family protein